MHFKWSFSLTPVQAYVACVHKTVDSPWFLVLISTSNEADQFHRFHAGREALQQVVYAHLKRSGDRFRVMIGQELLKDNLKDRMDDAVRVGNSFGTRTVVF
jgi:hypothetical protein